MSKSKKPQAKTEDKPKYRLGQKVFFADYTNLKPRLLEGKVLAIQGTTSSNVQVTAPTQEFTDYCYAIETKKGIFDVWQYRVHPSFQSAAIEHGKTIFEAL